MVNQVGLAVVRTLSIGTAFHLHLEEAEIDPELQFLAAIEARDFAHFDRAGFVRPIVEERVQIEAHREETIESAFALSTRAGLQPAAGIARAMAAMEQEIEAFIRYLAMERGLSENYQLSTQRSLGEFAAWCAQRKQIVARARLGCH